MLPYFVLLYLSVADAISLTSQLINTWDNFKSTYEKKYKFGFEDNYRFKVFKENMKKIDTHNKRYEQGKETYKMAANKFTDLTSEEFLSTFTCYKQQNTTRYSTGSVFLTPNFVKIPETVDWRDHGYVTPVKDQGACGSCWAFSASGSLEGQHFKKSKVLISLSEQNLVDCCHTPSTHGCEGGLMDSAFTCIQNSNGIDTESSYPYRGVDEDCSFDPQSVGATVTGYVDIPKGSEDKLVEAIATVGPISVAIQATDKFQFYKSGVLDDDTCNPELLNHGVLAVGYGLTRNGTKYYIVKNSWSQNWGQEGYILMIRDKKNQCGIASAASYPLV